MLEKISEEEKMKVKKDVLSLEEIEQHSNFDIHKKNLYEIERKLEVKVSEYQAIMHV